jgi:tetratricopeptide (TPR) repeat protein
MDLRRSLRAAAFALGIACCVSGMARAQERSELTLPPDGLNQKAEVSQWIGLVKVTITYHSPNVHGGAGGADRTGHIWGELVRYGMFDEGFGPSHATPWRAGANETTTIAFSHDVRIGGKALPAGTYALFLQLDPNGPYTWILSTQIGWGSFQYDPAHDALRVTATPQSAPYTEFLTYGFDDRRPASATAFLQWENKRVPLTIDVPNINELYITQLRKDLMGWPGFDYRNWQQAAQFCADNKINLEEALTWADKAINEPFRGTGPGREDIFTLRTKAAVLRAMGRDADAEAAMDKAVRLAGTPAMPIHQYGVSLIAAGKAAKAMEVFTLNRQRHPDDMFVTYVGLARGYTALGDKVNAIANWETALKNIPENQKPNLPVYERALKALKEQGEPEPLNSATLNLEP